MTRRAERTPGTHSAIPVVSTILIMRRVPCLALDAVRHAAFLCQDRCASDIVLLDDRFSSIVAAVAQGRRIFANLRRALTYVVAIHVPIASVALFPILLGMPPMLMPVHVMLLELIIDPVVALGAE